MTKLIDLIEEAASRIDTYKHPNLDAFRAAVDPILSALGECTVGGDRVESVGIDRSYVYITTWQSCRGCSNTNDLTIPIAIIEAEDPVRAATEHTLRAKLTKAVEELNYARSRVPVLEELSQKAALDLATFLKENA